MTWRRILNGLGLALALGTITPASAQNLISNGGFENQPGFTGNPYDYDSAPFGWTTNAAWNASGYDAVTGSAYGNPHSGNYSVRFGSDNNTIYNGMPTIISQTFADVLNTVYTVSFYTYNGQYVGESNDHPFVTGGHPNNYLTASVNGQSVTVPDNVGTFSNGCATCWVRQSFSFTGTGSDTLSFAAYTDANYWHLDDISVTGTSAIGAVPEPTTWAMMLIGFGALGVVMRRRQPHTNPVLA